MTGATGFLGHAVLRLLRARQLPLRALVRRSGELSLEPDEEVVGDLADPPSLDRLCQGSNSVIHLAAALGAASPARMHAVNVEGTRTLLSAACRAGVERFVLISSVAAGRPHHGPYSRTKRQAERLVIDSPLCSAVLRFPVLSGPQSQLESGVLGVARRSPLVPVLGGAPLRPLPVDDAAAACLAAAQRSQAAGIYTLAGPQALSFAQLARCVLQEHGLSRAVVSLPPTMIYPVVALLERIWGAPPITVEAARAAAAGTPPSSPRAEQDLGVPFRPGVSAV